MMRRLRALCACLLAVLLGVAALPAWAETVIAEGEAAIVNNDIAAAREQALRNALAAAARSTGVQVQSGQRVANHVLTSDQTTLIANASVMRHEVLDEGRRGGLYHIRIRAELGDGTGVPVVAGGIVAPANCMAGYHKRVLIGGFPLARPEELGEHELAGYARLTAREMARYINPALPLLVDTRGALQLRFALPETISPDVPIDPQTWAQIRDAARLHRSQYVIAGQFRVMAQERANERFPPLEGWLDGDNKARSLVLDVLVLDAYTSSCVARQRFSTRIRRLPVLENRTELEVPDTVLFGSTEHYATPFGAAYREVIRQAADWAGATASCLPFGARVVKVDGRRMYIDAGAEQGLANGDALRALRMAGEEPVRSLDGELLGMEKTVAGEAIIRSVYPKFSIIEFPDAGTPPLKAGDEVFGP